MSGQTCYYCQAAINQTTGKCLCDTSRKQCPYCGEWVYSGAVFTDHLGMHRCVARRRERRLQARQKVCPMCNREFTATRADGVFCSSACRQKAYRLRVTDHSASQIEAPASVTDRL